VNAVEDERGVIIGWLVKLIFGVALAGVVAYDTGATLVNYFGLDSTAGDVAVELSATVHDSSAGSTLPVDEARKLARRAGAKLVAIRLDDQGVLHVRLRRTADTLVARHIAALRPWTRAVAEASARTG
jgi:hypothetical protein